MIRRTETIDDISVTIETDTVEEMLELVVSLEELEQMEEVYHPVHLLSGQVFSNSTPTTIYLKGTKV